MIEPQDRTSTDGDRQRTHRFAHNAMACTFELFLVERDPEYAAHAAEAAFAEVDRLEQELSRFVPTSDVGRINALAAGQCARVGVETIECLQLAARLYGQTAGAFNVSFASIRPNARRGFPLRVDAKRCEVTVQADGVTIDLGAIGKGYAVDQIAALLRDWSIAAAVVHCGQSTVYAAGNVPGESGWTVAVRHPAHHDDTLGRVRLRDAALSGSGRKVHGDHIIDPRGGRPAAQKLGAWALAPSAALADALSTAFMVMRAEEVEAYCREHAEISALLYGSAAGGPAMASFGGMPVVGSDDG